MYHPLPKGKHNTTNGMFIDDITELLTNKLPQYQDSILLGDFNVHIEDQTNTDAVAFNETMTACSLEQHILGPTHVRGNTLDLFFMQLSNSFNITNATSHGYILDHCMVTVDINIKKQKYLIETKEIRDKTKLAGPTLAQNFTSPEIKESATIDEATSQLNTELHKSLDAMAPIKSIKFTNRPKHPWFNKYIREQKSVVKNHERKWRKYNQPHQWQAYTKERNVYNRLLIYQKKQTISKKINESKKDMKQLLHLVNNITMSRAPNPMPEGKSDAQLTTEFASFFLDKIKKIRFQFQNTDQYIPEVNASVPKLHELQLLTEEEIEKEICSMNNKTCELDAIPTHLMKDILPAVLKTITKIVNMSLTNWYFPIRLEDRHC